uniref:PspC domain-containing protein n=1 Tax=Eggerthella sinensis TaxID=242230 RepID=UPI0022E1E533
MTSEKRLLRSRKSLVGGVCAGVADYFDVDPVIVRILVVVFTFASAGLLAVPYVAMWVVVPLEPKEVLPLDVQPQAVHSETYGAVDVDASRKAEQGAPKGASAAQAAGWHYTHPSYTSAAHVPPEPRGATRTRPS